MKLRRAAVVHCAVIPILLTIDWFLDRCRTTSNVLGDMTVAVLLDLTAEETVPVPDSALRAD